MWSDDPVADFERHDRERAAALELLPICGICNEPIQDEYLYDINDEFFCECCMKRYFQKRTEDFIC